MRGCGGGAAGARRVPAGCGKGGAPALSNGTGRRGVLLSAGFSAPPPRRERDLHLARLACARPGRADGQGRWRLRRAAPRGPRTGPISPNGPGGAGSEFPIKRWPAEPGCRRSGGRLEFTSHSSAAFKSPARSKAQPGDGLNAFIMALEALNLFRDTRASPLFYFCAWALAGSAPGISSPSVPAVVFNQNSIRNMIPEDYILRDLRYISCRPDRLQGSPGRAG